ncbi:MAG: hypothetical protein ACEY3H_01455 [Wolbachia sp.]
MFKAKVNDIPDKSPNDAALKRFVTREPISIFSQIKNAKDEEKKELNQLLEILRKKLPEGFKIGAAVGEGDCFFDSVAQGLNELKDKGLITGSKGFSVKSLRESCKQYAQQVDQSKEGSWLDNALKVEIEELCEYIPRIEFTAEDIKNASSGSEIKILKLENAIWGRPEVEGKMICEKYGVKIRTIELRDEEIDGLYVTKGKVGAGNNIIYIVNYRNHFVPLLSNIEKDIKRSIKVSREEAYGNVIGLNSNNISQSYISIPLRDIENSSHKQSGSSRSPGKKNRKTSRKRGRSVTDKGNNAPKWARMDVNVTSNEDSEFPSDLQDEPRQDELHNAYQTNRCIPHKLIRLMYQLDLSVLCSLRESIYKHKYPSLSLAFGDSEIDEFNNIVLRYKKKSIHIQIENVDKYYIDNGISYARLFTKEKRSFSINNYFDSFVKHLISKSDSLLNNIEYLIIYTDSCLDFTEEKELKKGRFKNFYPFKFSSIDMEKYDILKDFLFTNDNAQGCGFYQFSQDKTREELLKRLEFSSVMQKVIKERKLSQKEIKEAFLDKLVFAVNQPSREELNSIIKSEMEKNSTTEDDYIALQEKILRDLTAPENDKKLKNYVSGIIYEFNLLMLFLHDMFLHKNMFFINFEGKSRDISNGITINYKDRFTYVKAHNTNSNVGYSQLFPSKQQDNTFSIDKLFIEKLREDIEYFIIYTNADLDLTEEKGLKKGQSKDFYPLKLDSIDIQKKKYKILRNCSCINENGLYRFSQEEITREKLLSLLNLPPSLQKEKEEGRFSDENEKEIKEKFLDKLILAINQPNREELNSVIRNEIDKSNVPYNYEELHEIALRWSESNEFGPITKGIMEKLLEDIKNNRSSYQEIQNKGIDKEIKFAKSVVGKEGIPAFDQFLGFLIKGEGIKYLEVLKNKGINLSNMSSILSEARANAEKAFKDLYNLWFDKQGNKTQYLKTLEKERINLSNMSSILSGAGANAEKAFKDLYDLWFDGEGNKTQYLKTLKKKGINLSNVSSILHGTKANAAKVFKDLYDLWFDGEGNKTQCLKTLEREGINLSNMSSILSGARAKAPKAFKDLYNLWFDGEGNKTRYLKALGKEGINLSNMSGILNGAGANAEKAFKGLYDLWFDEEGNKTQYLKTLEKEGINLSNVSSILGGAGANAEKAFKGLYDLWFDKEGNKTQYLKILEKEGINLSNVSSILGGAGANAEKAFKDLYDFWFDKEIQYLKTLEKEGINLSNMSSILHGAGANAAKAFRDLYDLWFDEQGNKTQYLKTLEKEGINLSNMSSILGGTGTKAVKAFKGLYGLWFDKQGNKMQYLKTLKKEGVDLLNISSILSGTGANAAKAFRDLYDLWFDEEGNKTQYLKTLEKEGISPANISSVLSKAGTKAPKVFKGLYDLWFDKQGNKTQYLKTLEKEGINLSNMSSILHGAGANAVEAFKELYNTFCDEQGSKTQHLKRFIKKKDGEKEVFTLHNLSGILSKAGANAKDAFEKLHSVCFNDEGKKTELLDDFYNAGFRPRNLSCMLCGAGVRAVSILKRLHSVCFNEKRERTKLLDDFHNAGFRLCDLCNVLSAAADSLEEFHNFCFIGETKEYLSHFLNEKEGFTPKNLSKILHGAGANICSALKGFHDICFDETENKTPLLADFHNAGFTPSNLSNILSMAGNNAASILRNFHKLCFNKENYLNHFLAEEELFTLKGLSKILDGAGTKICSTFERLHDLCFDKVGNKTGYLDNLIKNNPQNKILNILCEKVRKAPSTFLDEQSISEGDKATNAGLKPSNSSGRTEQKQNLDSLQQSDSKVKKKTRKGITNQSKNRQDDKILDTVAGSSCSSRDLSPKQIQSVHHNKKQREVSSHLSKFVSSIEPARQGLYLPSFEKRGVEIDGKCVAMTRSLSQALLSQNDKSFLSNLETSAEIYERIAQGKQVFKREEREVFAFSKLLDSFEKQLDSSMNSLPSSSIHTNGYKTLGDLSNYIAGVKGNFAIHLVTSNHVVAIYRTGDNYAYFDSNVAFVSGLKSVDQLMQVIEREVKFAGYEVGEKGFLVEHFNVDKANSQLSSEDKQILAKEIKTERQLLAEQDKEFGLIKMNGQEVSRVQLYDFGTKIDVEGSVPLLINADMNLSSKKFQDLIDKEEVGMTAREYLGNLKDSKNVEEVVQATKFIPFIGSKREIEEAKQTRKPKQSLLELAKGIINCILAAVSLTSASWSKSQLPEKAGNEPQTCLNDPIVDKQLQKSL